MDTQYKQCSRCKKFKHFMEFGFVDYKDYDKIPRLHSYCKECNCFTTVLHNAKKRSADRGLPFDLVSEDIVIPNYCPVLGIKLERGSQDHDNSPSIDRIDNTKGYLKDNIIVVSNRVNRIKNDSTVEELEKITEFYKKLLTNRQKSL